MLTHTSGLSDAYVLQGWAPSNGNSNDAFIHILSPQRGLNSAPGAEYQYNNGGYLLLGTILERASGQTLGSFADANIFKPLGMTGAYFNSDAVRTPPNSASGYSPQPNGWRLVPEGSGYAGNAGMMSSMQESPALGEQLCRRARGHGGAPHGHADGTGADRRPDNPGRDGIRHWHLSGGADAPHVGGDFGVATELVLYPDQELAIAVLCNMDSVVMGGLATVNVTVLTNGVADIFFDDLLEPRPAARAGAPPPPRPTEPIRGRTGK